LQVRAVFHGAYDAMAISPDGSSIVTRGPNYFLKTFDVATRTPLKTIVWEQVERSQSVAVLSPNGQVLVTGSVDGSITFYDAKTGAAIETLAHPYATNVFQLAFSPNGKLLATAGGPVEAEWRAPAAKIWDAATHKLVASPPGHTELVLAVAFAPDGKTLATCSVDDSIRFWDTTTWKEIPPALGHKEYVAFLAYLPDGRTLATACSNGTMKLWNVATRRELASLKLEMAVQTITFSPDGKTLAAYGWDHLLRLWRAPLTDK
jgi:WD40 repeat protein